MNNPIIKAIDIITTDYYDYKLNNINNFKSFVTTTLNDFNIKSEIFDILFVPGKNDCSVLHYLVIENKYELFTALLKEYQQQFKMISPIKWEFMLMEGDNQCHEAFTNFYGKEYFNKIAQSEISLVTGYSEPSFKKYYLAGNLDHFYKIENINKFDENPNYEMVHALNFFAANKEEFKNFMLEKTQNKETKFSLNSYKYENLIYKVQEDSIKKLKDGTCINIKGVTLTLPSQEDIDVLVERWGIKKTSKVLVDYLKFQKEYTISTNKNNLLKVGFDGSALNALIKSKIDFSGGGDVLSFGLKSNTAHLSYFIINGIISKEDLLIHITDKELKKEASYNILDASLDINHEPSVKKIKI
jgi:hypothetical protein